MSDDPTETKADRPLNVLVTAFGSPGDIFPLIGIAAAMKARGHDVTFIANEHFAKPVQTAGLTLVPSGDAAEYRTLLDAKNLWSPGKGLKILMERGAVPAMRRVYAAIAERNQSGRTVVAGSSYSFGARIAQDKLGIPTATVHISPGNIISAHRDHAKETQQSILPFLPLKLRRGVLNWTEKVFLDRVLAPPINAFRAELGLPPVARVQSQWLHSPLMTINVYPDWFNPPKPDWPPQVRNTGFILFDGSGGAALPEELAKFLDAGEPPIAIITGSGMVQGREFLRESVSAIGALRKRAVFVCPRREMLPPNLPPWAMWASYAPYQALFPRCAAVIHQGAIGTSAIAMASAVPQIAVPQAADQYNNAGRLQGLGVAPVIRPEDYAAPIVTRVLRQLLSAERAATYRDFAIRVREARPLEKICPMLESLAQAAPNPAAAPA